MFDEDDELFSDIPEVTDEEGEDSSSGTKHTFDGQPCHCGITHDVQFTDPIPDEIKPEIEAEISKVIDGLSDNDKLTTIVVSRMDRNSSGGRNSPIKFIKSYDASLSRVRRQANQSAAYLAVAQALDEVTQGRFSEIYEYRVAEMQMICSNFISSLTDTTLEVVLRDFTRNQIGGDEHDQAQMIQYLSMAVNQLAAHRETARSKYLEAASHAGVEAQTDLSDMRFLTDVPEAARALLGELSQTLNDYSDLVATAVQVRKELDELDELDEAKESDSNT